MGACCTKFGSYLLKKEEAKVISNGGTPKLNKLEHKQSFVATPAATDETKGTVEASEEGKLIAVLPVEDM